MPTSAATVRTAASETALRAGSAAETNKSQPINPKINNRTARKTADQARGVRKDRAVLLVVMCTSIQSRLAFAFALRTPAVGMAALLISATMALVRQSTASN